MLTREGCEEPSVSTVAVAAGELKARPSWPARLRRAVRIIVIGNLALAALIVAAGVAAHRWATSSEERLERAIVFATRYVLVPASLVEDHGFRPEALEGAMRLIERVVIDGAGLGPRHDAHLYWQGRVLMAMPAAYKRFGRTEERIERARRGIAIFADLAARNSDSTDYRRRLTVTLNMHGDDLAELGRHHEANAQRLRAIGEARQLLARQPGHWRWRWYVAWAELGTAQSLAATGEPQAARGHAATAREIADDLCRESPDDERLCTLARRAADFAP